MRFCAFFIYLFIYFILNFLFFIACFKQQATLKTIGDSRESHVEIMGPMLEDLELDLRNTIEGIYFQKTKEIINGMRVTDAEIKSRQKVSSNILVLFLFIYLFTI